MPKKPSGGTSVPDNRKYSAITRRVEELGKLNDAYESALTMGDCWKLSEIAEAYETMGLPRKANEIRLQAENL